MALDRPLRIVQWTTGKVARESIKAILDRPELELVGVYAYSADKVGRDVGELVDLGRRVGVGATDDVDALIALRPDCVAYMPLHPDVDHLVTLLGAGINVVSTASFLTGRGYGEDARRRISEAALAGGATIFGSGVNPGWADYLAATASSPSRDVSLVRMTESFNIGIWAGDANQDALGWGRPAGDPGHAADIEKATLPFGDAVEAIAEMFRITLDDVRCSVEFAHATEDVDIEGRPVQVGQVAGIQTTWQGVVEGRPVIEASVRWTITTDLEPDWPVASAHIIEIFGTPKITVQMEFLPEDLTLPMEELLSTGFIVTALPVVNAIPAVVAARPGIVTYADLPPITARLRPSDVEHPPTVHAEPTEDDEPVPAAGTAGTPDSVAGEWKIVIKGPTGPQETLLSLVETDGVLSGEQSGDGMSSPITEARLDGSTLFWINHVTKPMKLKVKFTGVVNGSQISGKVKAGFMGSYPFTGSKL